MMETQLTRFSDVVKLNAFIATQPRRAHLTYKTSRLAGLWQLDLVDPENEKNQWMVGYYIDGMEDREIIYDIAVKLSGDSYVDEELDEKLHYTPYVVQWGGGVILITLPHEYRKEVLITAPQICDRAEHPLWEPVYIWRDTVGYFNVLDCGAGLDAFKTWEEFKAWVEARVCTDHERSLIHWPVWYVIPGAVSDAEDWSDAVRRAVRGRYNPTPDDVIEHVQKYLI
jgi:hypothetical protein